MKPEITIGLEVHTELSTNSKIFCSCTTAFLGEENTHICPICAGLPGVLPKLNEKVILLAIRLGLCVNATINKDCAFDRKNYFYPDLPKAYQISQLYAPICQNGKIKISNKTINIRQIHIEEDAGKLLHTGSKTFIDFNRCGVPLLEIVSEPDFENATEVIEYLKKLREILIFLDVSDCKMQEGSLRCDVNLSIKNPDGSLGTRTEIKNLNSFKAVSRAIEYEANRQIEILARGKNIIQETRRWDDEGGFSESMRSKENAHDYRYFPEPDLPKIKISNDLLEEVKTNLPELASKKRERYTKEYLLTEKIAYSLTENKQFCTLFEKIISENNTENKLTIAKETANLITGEIFHLQNTNNIPSEVLISYSSKLSLLIKFLIDGKINRDSYKECVRAVITKDAEPEKYITEKGLFILSDNNKIDEMIKKILSVNENAVLDYKSGKPKAFSFLMGAVMRELKGSGNPEIVRKRLEIIISSY